MNLLLEKPRRSPEAANRLASVLEGLTVIVVAAPTAEPRDKGTQSRVSPDDLPTSDLDDDLANATWEDAEWQ